MTPADTDMMGGDLDTDQPEFQSGRPPAPPEPEHDSEPEHEPEGPPPTSTN
jgi:hypothetical protein